MAKKIAMLIISLFFISSFSFAQDSLTEIKLMDTYSKYGFSFKYPLGMKLSEHGLPRGLLTEEKGEILGILNPNDELFHSIRISWLESAPQEGKEEEFLDIGYDLVSGVKKDGSNLIKKNKGSKLINGHKLIYQFYEIKDDAGFSLFGILSSWYCPESKRSFTLNIGYSKKEVLPLLENYINLFICHVKSSDNL